MDLKLNCKSSTPSIAPFSKKKTISGNLDDGLADGKIDVTESSSPSRKKIRTNHLKDHAQEEALPKYKLWMFKYPSALTSFEQMTDHAKGKKIALFLDYDGTLSPIVNHPDSAFMSSEMRTAVKSVAEYFPTAIISGRSRDKVFELVGLTELYYAGSHGMDMMGPVRGSKFLFKDYQNCIRSTGIQRKESQMFQPATEFLPTINKVFRSLVESMGRIKGAIVENNKFTVSVHYRQVEKKAWLDVSQIVHDTLKDYPNLKLTHGRKVLEIRPILDWNKGKAVEFLLQSLDLGNSEDVLPIFVGDDRTDEDAFKVLREKTRGYGIVVSSVPKDSSAFYSLRDPSEVLVFLRYLVNWGGSDSIHSK